METGVINEHSRSQVLQENGSNNTGTILEMEMVNERSRDARKEMIEFNEMRRLVCLSSGDYDLINSLCAKITSSYRGQAESAKVYLFSWNDFSEKDYANLIEFLIQKFKVEWVKSAKIEKTNDGEGIRVFTEDKSILLNLNDKKNTVYIKINNTRKYKLAAINENGKLNIYAGVRTTAGKRGYGPKMRHAMTFLREHAVYDDRDIKEFAGRFVGTEL